MANPIDIKLSSGHVAKPEFVPMGHRLGPAALNSASSRVEADPPLGAFPNPRPGAGGAAVSRPSRGPVGGALKRATDITLAGIALVALLPVALLIAALIRWRMGNPVLYFHERVGYDGKVFRCYKFRSMINNGDEVLARHFAANPSLEKEWKERQKLKRDPRVPPLGRFLRVTSLDELPQLINILRGDMSCVGPRPITARELERYGHAAADYMKARPGLTGAWQISGRNAISYEERVRLDADYVRNWSWRGDWRIILKTPLAVVRIGQTS